MTEHTINTTKIYEESYEKWRNAIFKANLICVGIVMVMEFLIWGIFEVQDLRLQPLGEYLVYYMLLPTLFNLLILFVGFVLMRFANGDTKAMNYVPIVQMVCLSFSLCVFHNLFSVLLCTFSFPIFLTAIFSDRRMTKRITILCIIGISLAQLLGPLITHSENEYRFTIWLVSLAIIASTNVISNVLIQFQKQKDKKLESVYKSRREALEQLKYDQKTGLYAHTSFQTGLRELVESSTKGDRPAVAVLDIDDFKKVNDTYGHVKGDVVLLELARIMRTVCGEKYIAARFGGEEFAILFRGGNIGEYVRVVETIRQEFEQICFEFRREPVTVSIGLAMWKRGWDVTEFFDRADEALYISKRQGKNRTTVCDESGMKAADVYKHTNTQQGIKLM
ncbi:MAG: GGDEF domain-containing protein [Lachnospiraceae bacterium]|nr:GGDEF domain-containing protein [Lachnospiraceae bacterium]